MKPSFDADIEAPGSGLPFGALQAAALASIANAVMITDAHGHIVWVNDAFTTMSGYSPDEAKGHTPRLLKSGVQGPEHYATLWSTILAGNAWQGEIVNRHKDGHHYRVAQTITPVFDAGPSPTHFVAVHDDVTELRESQARIQALFDHALDAVVFFDDDGRCVDANPAACALVGRDLDELVSSPVSELLADGQWSPLWCRSDEGPRTVSGQVRQPDGAVVDVAVRVVTDVLPGVHVAVCQDVTARRAAERERDFEAQLAQAAGTALIVTDLAGRVIYWNAAASRLYGWSSGEVMGRDIREVNVFQEMSDQAEQIMVQVTAGQSWTGEFEVRRRDGTSFPALVTNAPFIDDNGQLAGIIGVSADISELQDARRQAQRHAAQQAAVARLSRRALTELDDDRLFDEAGKAIATELGVPMVSILELSDDGQQLSLRAGTGEHEEQVGALVVSSDDPSLAGYTLTQGHTVVVDDLAVEIRFDTPAPLTDLGVVSALCTPIEGSNHSYGVLAAMTTTHRRFTDDDIVFIEAIAATLGSAIARGRIETELQATAARLAHSDDIRLAFLRATSHELRTPLSVVVGFAETLKDHHDELTHQQRQLVFHRLHANAGRLRRLIEDLLDVDRLNSGLMTADRQPHDLTALIRRVADDQGLDDRHLELDLDEVEAEVDPPKFERIVANLLANAVRHSPPGGTVTIRLRRDGDQTVLTVQDDGSGIDPDYLEAIFEPFVQGPDRHQAAQPGTGLGLTLARDLIHLHGGRITATNLNNGGARFQATIPDTPDLPETP